MSTQATDPESMVPTLADLPTPQEGKTGWPWTKQSDSLPETQPDGNPWPKISIVTPSYNQGQFIEETIRSVLLQGYPNLEYIVIDGGSTDETVQILEKYDPWIDHWVGEPDEGQSHAINKGFEAATGEFGNWQNSDDLYCKNAFRHLLSHCSLRKDSFYVGECVRIDREGKIIGHQTGAVRSLEDLVDLDGVWRSGGAIPQAAVMFPLDAFRRVGRLDTSKKYNMDYHLWGKFFLSGMRVEYINSNIGQFRIYEDQKISAVWKTTNRRVKTAINLIRQCDSWSSEKKERHIQALREHRREAWRGTGRLARLGLPEPMVRSLRWLESVLQIRG